MFKIRSVIIMDLWKMHLEARTLLLVWMDMNCSLMMMKRVFQKGDPNEEVYQRPSDSREIY